MLYSFAENGDTTVLFLTGDINRSGSLKTANLNQLGYIETATTPLDILHPKAAETGDPRLGSYINIISQGAVAGGVTDNTTALNKAVTAAQAIGGGIYIPAGTFKTNSVALTVPVLCAPGASILEPATGQTVTVTRDFAADRSQHFNNALAGQGTISWAGNSSLTQVYPEWWGAVADGTTDSMAAFQQAVNTGMIVSLAATLNGSPYSLDNASTPLMLNNDSTSTAIIKGAGQNSTLLKFTSTATPCIQIDFLFEGAPSVYLYDFYIRGAAGVVSTVAGNHGIYVPGYHDGVAHRISNLVINNVQIDQVGGNGIRIQGGTGPVRIVNPIINDTGDYGIQISSDANPAVGASTVPQDVTITGGSIQGSDGFGCIGGIAIIGTGSANALSMNITDTDIELRGGQTKPCLYLEHTGGAVIIGVTLASIVSSLTIGDADIYFAAGCYGNVVSGIVDNASAGLNNFHFTSATYDNTVVGGVFLNNPAGPGYFRVMDAGQSNNKFISPFVDAGGYQAGHAVFDTIDDVYGAAITIDVTIPSHVISASNTTAAGFTLNPSGPGAPGDWLYIETAADNSGKVTATFAAPFHSKAAQATTANRFSSIAFKSDGTRWLEQYRTTNLS